MNNSCICNETAYIGRRGQNRIAYTFATEDGITSSGCMIRSGDTDPLTGMPVPEEIFRMYHRIRNRQIYHDYKAERQPYSRMEKEAREKERAEIAEAFEKAYGYSLTREAVECRLEDRWGGRYPIRLEACTDPWWKVRTGRFPEPADPTAEAAFPGNGDDDTERLREFAATLSGRLLDVYLLMLEKASGGAGARRGKDVAAKWHVSPAVITRDREKITRMIRAWFAPAPAFQ